MPARRRNARPRIPAKPGYLTALQKSATEAREQARGMEYEITTEGPGCRCLRQKGTDNVLSVYPGCPEHGDGLGPLLGPPAA